MSRTILLVGTRKGCFLLESDADRRDWTVRGPFCEGWPIYHAVHDADSGAIYAAAASEWHGAGVWRSPDLGETWELSSEGLTYGENGRKVSKISGLTAAHGRLLAGVEAPGIFESRDGGKTFSLLSTLDGQPHRELWNDPANQPPGHLGLSAIAQHPDDASRFWAIIQGHGAASGDRSIGSTAGCCGRSGIWAVTWWVSVRGGCSTTTASRPSTSILPKRRFIANRRCSSGWTWPNGRSSGAVTP